jgi:molybdate transport system ATP-binding protein
MLRVAAKKQRGAFLLDAKFELPTPGIVALFGRSGCGKSTLVNVIAGLALADAGRIELDDTVLLDTERGINVPPEERRIGYVFQDARLFPHLRVEANLRYALKRAAVAPFVGMDLVVELLDLKPLMSRRTHQLSGGERQRVAIGRALLSQPSLLLLDEPLASLDASRREEVLPYLETLRDQLALPMVYVSHNFDEVLRLATHLVLMEAGNTIAQGNLSEMSLHPRVRAIIGTDAVGAIVDGTVLGTDASSGLTRVQVGQGELKVHCGEAAPGTRLRVQLLARDLIVATEPPRHISVRNSLAGVVTSVADDVDDSDLIAIDVGGILIMARVTKAATRELGLGAGKHVWALVKTASLRPHLI